MLLSGTHGNSWASAISDCLDAIMLEASIVLQPLPAGPDTIPTTLFHASRESEKRFKSHIASACCQGRGIFLLRRSSGLGGFPFITLALLRALKWF